MLTIVAVLSHFKLTGTNFKPINTMKTWFEFRVQDYMSPRPEIEYRSYDTKEEAENYAQSMSKSAWSGTVTLIGVADPAKLLAFAKEVGADSNIIEEIVLWSKSLH